MPGSARSRRAGGRRTRAPRRCVSVAAAEVVGGEQHAGAPEPGVDLARLGAGCGRTGRRRAAPSARAPPRAAISSAAQAAARRGPRCRCAARAAARRRASCSAGGRPTSTPQASASADGHGQAERVDVGLEANRKRADERHRADGVACPRRRARRRARPPPSASSTFSVSSSRDDARAAGAERHAHADFALPRAGPRQHQVRGVAAHREQHQQHDALQGGERPVIISCGPRGAAPERHHLGRSCWRCSRDRRGPAPHHAVDVRLRLGLGRAGREPPEHGVAARLARSSSSREPASSDGASVAGTHIEKSGRAPCPGSVRGRRRRCVRSRSLTRRVVPTPRPRRRSGVRQTRARPPSPVRAGARGTSSGRKKPSGCRPSGRAPLK